MSCVCVCVCVRVITLLSCHPTMLFYDSFAKNKKYVVCAPVCVCLFTREWTRSNPSRLMSIFTPWITRNTVINNNNNNNNSSSGTQSSTPVSYTHLDVYKRQEERSNKKHKQNEQKGLSVVASPSVPPNLVLMIIFFFKK